MRVSALALAIAIAAPSAWAGELTVTVAPGRITLAANATPVSDILDLLARKTGMKIIYDGAPPRLLVSPQVERETASQAVLAVLEGLGLAYVLITDPTASQVETLFIASGAAGKGSAPPANRPPGLDEPQEKPRPQPDEDEEEEMGRPMPTPQEPEPPRAEPPRPQPPPSAVFPGSPFAPQGPPQPVLIPGQPFIPGVTPLSPPTPPPQE